VPPAARMNAAIVALTLLAMLVGSVQSAVLLRRPSVRCSAARLRPSKRCPTQALMLMYSTSFRLLAGPRRRLLPSRAAPAMDALPTDTPRFRRTRMVTFVSIAVGYASYYLARNSLTYVAPVMLASLGGGRFDITTVGLITSVFSLCYGVSKFVSGVLGDRIDARTLLAGGLMLTAVCCSLSLSLSPLLLCPNSFPYNATFTAGQNCVRCLVDRRCVLPAVGVQRTGAGITTVHSDRLQSALTVQPDCPSGCRSDCTN